MNPEVLIVGTGALGSLFAARLASSGVQVTMLGTWPSALKTIHAEGLRLQNGNHQPDVHQVRITNDPIECREARFALVLVKAWQTERAALQLAKCLPINGLVVTLQNGLGNQETLGGILGPERVALGVTTTGATLLGPGLVRPGGEGIVSIEMHPRLSPLTSMLKHAGFRVQTIPDAQTLIWSKLVINAAINPLTAVLGIPNGELLRRPDAHVLMGELARETANVATAQSIKLSFTNPLEAAEDVARRTGENHSSMLQDVNRGAPTEIDAICGAITRAGKNHQIPTPFNQVFWKLVSALVQ